MRLEQEGGSGWVNSWKLTSFHCTGGQLALHVTSPPSSLGTGKASSQATKPAGWARCLLWHLDVQSSVSLGDV